MYIRQKLIHKRIVTSRRASCISIAVIYSAGMLALAEQNVDAAFSGKFTDFMMHLFGVLSKVEHISQYRHTSARELRKRLQSCLD